MPRRKQTGICIECWEDPCECQPVSKKKTGPSARPARTTKPVQQESPSASSEVVDVKAAMKAASVVSVDGGTVALPAPDPEASLTLIAPVLPETVSDEELNIRAILAPILHPDEIVPYKAEIWKRRRRDAQQS